MLPVEIKKNVWWVGAIDWELRNFHGYITQRGSSYNAYLIVDEAVTLIDNVKPHLYQQMLQRISHIIDPAKIDYLIQNHVEMDHSGSLPCLKELNPKAKILTSVNGEKGIKLHYKKDWEMKAVKNNESVRIGSRTFQFIHTPMVHWPDNMLTYCPEEKILFSNDAFGQHIASLERFDDEYPFDITMFEAKKYYANIVLPYGAQVQRALPALSAIDFDTIAPSHGLIWRKNIPAIAQAYANWSANKTEKKAVIVYDTMWKSTELMADSFYSAFEKAGISVVKRHLQANHISDIMTDVIDAEYICVGSPTLNNNMLPTVSAFLTYLKGLSPKNRKALAFGSYGWGGQSIGIVEEELKKCNFDVLASHKVQYIPSETYLKQLTDDLYQLLNNHKQ
jgi:flavorubredoxin